MSDDALAQIDANGEDNSPAIGLIAQYIKDLSFENPNAPAVYQWQGQPQIDVQFNIGVQVAGENVHEVVLNINVRASSADKVAYQVELAFAGLFGARNIPEDQLQAFMLIDAPALLFPFARRVVADAIRDGSFPPLLLDPIDFRALYLQQAEAAQGEPQGNA
ncbi:MAG: protein-export chaperone SecB [Sphingomonadales bacterium]|jgi:preprotein translocase subunit SecB|nr:protein-export chaperone SecB [Sphingomonadales bacterium]